MKLVIVGSVLALIVVGGYFVAPSFGMDATSWAFGALVSGVLVAAVSAAVSGAASAPSASKKAPSSPRVNTGTSSYSGPRKTIYVGNLAFKANRHALTKLFEEYGQVLSARVATDRNTRKPKGYGFVEMPAREADIAIKKLDGHTFFGRNLKVDEAKD